MALRKAGGNWVVGDRFFDRDVEIEALMLGVRGQVHLEHYQNRLRMVLGDESYEVALELLTEAAVTGQLTDGSIRRYQAFRSVLSGDSTARIKDVLYVLEHDGYLALRDGVHRFVSGLVEEWWRDRNGRGFVPFRKRSSA